MADQDVALAKALRGLGGLHSLSTRKARAATVSDGDSTRAGGSEDQVSENQNPVEPVAAEVPPVAPRAPKKRKTVEEQIQTAAADKARLH